MMKATAAVLAAALMMTTSAMAGETDSAVVQRTVRSMFKAANAGDPSAGKYFTEDGAVVDEFAPFGWQKFPEWFKADDDYNKANGITDAKTALLKFRHVNVTGNRAYVVMSMEYSFKAKGKVKKEPSTEVVALVKQPEGWRVNSFAFFGKAGVDQGRDATAITALVRDFAAANGTGKVASTITAVTDEFPSYTWMGANAAVNWSADLQKAFSAEHNSDLVIVPAAASQISISGRRAYAAFPTLLTIKHEGKPATEHGAFAFTFEKTGNDWHIVSWAWATD